MAGSVEDIRQAWGVIIFDETTRNNIKGTIVAVHERYRRVTVRWDDETRSTLSFDAILLGRSGLRLLR